MKPPHHRLFVTAIAGAWLSFGAPVQAGLVAHWPLDADAGDATGNGHDGSVIGGTVDFGQTGANPNTGSAASFPDNGHIDVPFDAAINPGILGVDGSGSFTVALWCNPNDTTGFNSPFTAREDNGTSVNGPIIYNTPTNVWSYWGGNNGPPGAWNVLDSTVPAIIGTWQHVAITYDAPSTTRKMFVDGVEVLSAQIGMSANAQRDTHIGAGQDDGNNFFWNGLIDDVGLWDQALTVGEIQAAMTNGVPSALPDPRLTTPPTVAIQLDRIDDFALAVQNTGEMNALNVSAVAITGADAASFGVTSLPAALDPGASGDIAIHFDSSGAVGIFNATFEITSNDPINGSVFVGVTVTVREPEIAVDSASLDFGLLAPSAVDANAMLVIRNLGDVLPLEIASLTITGTHAANFSIDGPTAMIDVAIGASTTIDLTFTPMGVDGTFAAQLEIASNDFVTPVVIVPLTARVVVADPLVAWWPLDVDAMDATGNGHDGVVVGGTVTFGQPGANGGTALSAAFPDNGHIDVPFASALNPASFTVTLWANPSAAGGGTFRSPITSRDDVSAGVSTHGFILYNNSGGAWDFWTGDGDPGWDTLAGPAVVTNQWTHVAIVYEAATDTKTLYINGAVAVTNGIPQSGPTQYSPNGAVEMESLHIGAGSDPGTSFYFAGNIDDVGLFRSALSAPEIAAIMNEGVVSLVSTARFEITLIERLSDTEARITWNSRPGTIYAVDRAIGGLAATDWEERTDNAIGDGETTSFTDTGIPADANGVFFRVRVVQ